MGDLLSVDMGLRTGLALYGQDGRLQWFRSHNLGNTSRLKKAAYSILRELNDLDVLLVEGGGPLADIWCREAERRGAETLLCHAEDWRQDFLFPREQRSGTDAKHHADLLARNIIRWSGLPTPKTLRHDAAEAILAGLWGCRKLQWIDTYPNEIIR